MREWSYGSTILNLGTRWRCMVSITTGTDWRGSFVNLRAGMDVVEKRKTSSPCRESKTCRNVIHISAFCCLDVPFIVLSFFRL
jgi:hypothetical protein